MKHPDAQTQRLIDAVHPVSRETMRRLGIYRELLERWQAKTNLVSPATLDDFWLRHVADSLQVLALRPDCCRWTDLGSGGGFPGLVLAICLADSTGDGDGPEEGDCRVNLVESNQKKCAFLRQVTNAADAPARVHCKRIESAAEQIEDCRVITARALAPLSRLLEWTGEHITDGRIALFPKGRDYLREIQECHGRWQFDLIEHPGSIDPQSRILEIANVSRRPR